ncbi:MAG TPA: TAXI family TRAP transporter solute-binding subunit [Kineosporiaceae bacterium]
MTGASCHLGRRTLLVAAGAGVLGVSGVAVALADRRGPDRPRSVVLATGPPGAVFLEVGRDLARAVRALSPGTTVTTLITAASVENLRLLAGGKADLGLASLDASAVDRQVLAGSITAVCRLYDSVLHLVVPAASGIRTLADCGGKIVSVGAGDSGTEFTTLRLLDLARVRPAGMIRLAQTEAMDALGRGTVDAAFSLTGFPTGAIRQLADRQPLRLVPLAAFAPLLEGSIPQVYAPAVVPAGTYHGIGATPTVSVPNLLLARPALPDSAATLVTEAVLSAGSRRFWTHSDSRRIDVRTAIATGPASLHPAALAWLRAHKP